MDARKFYDVFLSMVKEESVYGDKDLKYIYKNDPPAFTKIINNVIVQQIIVQEGLEYQHEYFRIDTVGWEKHNDNDDNNDNDDKISDELRKRLGLTRYLWNLKIAVEHENNRSDWTDEVIKLVHIRCPLKVVIGYACCDERGDMEKEKLSFVYECISRTNAYDVNADEELLIILGNCAARHKVNGSYDRFDYRGYILSKGDTAFVELKSNNI